MNQTGYYNIKFSEGLGIFHDYYGYPELDKEPKGEVVDMKGGFGHAGNYR